MTGIDGGELLDALATTRALLREADSPDQLMEAFAVGSGDLFPCDVCQLVTRRGDGFVAQVATGYSASEPDGVIAADLAADALEAGEPVLVSDAGAAADYRSLLAIPIDAGDVVIVGAGEPDAFAEPHVALGDVLGTYLAEQLRDVLADVGDTPTLAQARQFVELANVLMVVIDEEGTVTFANEATRSLLGFDEGELVGRDWFETAIPERNRAEVRDVFEAVLAGDREAQEVHENPVLTRDGDERIVEWHNTYLRDASGRPCGTLSAGQDVTERRVQKRQLEQEREKYSTLVDQFPNGVVTLFDEDFRYQLVGGTGFDNLDLAAEDLLDNRLTEVFPPENAAELEPLYEDALAGTSGSIEVTLGGRVFRIRVVPVTDQDGTVISGMTVSQDVTEEKRRERELDEAKKRYESLLQAAPDPIFVADAETGEIIEVNEAAVELRGQPREEHVGLHQSDLHPRERADLYREAFATHVEEGGSRRRLPDGSQMYVCTRDGERVPVEINVKTVDLADRRVIFGIFHDISHQVAYEETLTRLNQATRDLFQATNATEIASGAVETATDVLDLSAAGVFLLDEEEGRLVPAAHSPPAGIAESLSAPEFGPESGVAWQVFSEGEMRTYEDVREAPNVYNPETPIRSEILVPLGDHGVFIVGSTSPGAYTDEDVELVEILASTARVALDRVERVENLQRREHELERRTAQLEAVELLNAQIRDVAEAIVESDTRQEVAEAVCRHLASGDQFDFVWLAEIDPVEHRLTPRAQAGAAEGYLGAVSLDLDASGDPEPTVAAALSNTSHQVSNVAGATERDWQSEAAMRGFQSAMSIPLVYQDTLQGVLSVYSPNPQAFPGILQSVLTELGQLIAHALVAIDRKQSLMSNQLTELDFSITDRACLFLQFAQDTGCTLDLESIIPQADESSLVFVAVEEGSPAELLAAAEHATAVVDGRIIDTAEGELVQLRFVEPFIVSILSDQGITVSNISADEAECRVTMGVPPTFDVRRVIDIVTATYPDSSLVAKREHSQSLDSMGSLSARVFDRLTARQREVLELAFLRGYFDSPKRASGQDLADQLGISSSAFHNHVRTAERKLFEALFENKSPGLDVERPDADDH